MSQKKAKHLLIWGLRLGVVFLLSVGVGIWVQHPMFKLAQVDVFDRRFTQEEELNVIIADYIGHNALWEYARQKLPNELIQELPKIKGAKLKLDWPNHLQVTVIEKKPWISIWVDGKSVVVAHDGTVLSNGEQSVALNEDENLPIIRGIEIDEIGPVLIQEQARLRIASTLTAVETYFPSTYFQVEFLPNHQLNLIQNDTLPIRIGTLEDLKEKIYNLNLFLTHVPPGKDIRYIDLRVPDRVIVHY